MKIRMDPEHRGYFSGAGWNARCLRAMVGEFTGESGHEEFTDGEKEKCLRHWLEFGEKTYTEDRLEDFVNRIEEAAVACRAHSMRFRVAMKEAETEGERR